MTRARKRRGRRPRFYRIFKTRMGWCGLVGGAEGVARVILPMTSKARVKKAIEGQEADALTKDGGCLVEAERQIKEYLAGRRSSFNVRLRLSGLGAFDRAVYGIVRRIPYGCTATYGWVAQRVGKPRAARAVGAAMARNPLPLFIPCHRVVGSDGRLCGFSAEGGLGLKQRLLDLERRKSQGQTPNGAALRSCD